jgi:hypothetical protein
MKIQITEKAKKEAREYANQIASLDLMKKDNYTQINRPDRYYIGYLGEWAFSRFLVKNNIQFKWATNASGKSDNGDFIVRGKTIDIKTASQANYKRMMTPEKQLIHRRDYYIAIKLDGDEADILGFATYEDLNQTPTEDFGYGPTKAINLQELKDINFLIEQWVKKTY